MEKEEKSTKAKKKHGVSFENLYSRMQENLPLMIWTCIISFILMALIAVAVFFLNVEGAEKVMVPNIIGKKWNEAFLEMQAKQLYPYINLRYSDTPGDENTVLDQDPKGGAIVKGYSQVTVVISRGVVVDSIENYVGENLDDLRLKLQTIFAGYVHPLISIGDISYEPDSSEAGTILQQEPPEGTAITEPISVNLVVSRGPQYDNARVPDLIGKNINDILQTIPRSKLIFDFTSHIAEEYEEAGTVVNQLPLGQELVSNYSHVTVDWALPQRGENENIYGIFDAEIDLRPYAIPMRLDAIPLEGNSYTIINLSHPGGHITIPYSVAPETTLILYVDDKVELKKVVQ